MIPRIVTQQWVVSWDGRIWTLEQFQTIAVIAEDVNWGVSRIMFDMPEADASSDRHFAVVPTRDVELYTNPVQTGCSSQIFRRVAP